MPRFVGSVASYPARMSCLWYLGAIAVGALLLWLPFSAADAEHPISVIDAIFTATSATCVTGLVVRSTGGDFSIWGQLVILLLIQLGGIGIMTITTFVAFELGGVARLRQRAALSETIGDDSETDLTEVLRGVILVTFGFEAAGAAVLLAWNLAAGIPFWPAAWHAVFHAVSAFCNAGFALQDNSFVDYQGSAVVSLTLIVLIVCGGIGFPVMIDLRRVWKRSWRDRWHRLYLHSKLMLLGTAALLLIGFVSFLLLEWDGVLQPLPVGEKILAAAFQSVTCRTAGFNTVPQAQLTNASLFFSIMLMIVGAGPGSTGGGLKVSTFAILVGRSGSTMWGHRQLQVFRRTIPNRTIDQANATALVFAAIAIAALTTVLFIEQSAQPHVATKGLFLDALFEIISALGTVGLSTGLTDELSDVSLAVIMLLMYVGRLGPMTVSLVLSRGRRDVPIEFPYEEPLVG